MSDKFNEQKDTLLSIKHEISLLHQQVDYLLRNEKELGLLDLDVMMNRTHTIYDQMCSINIGNEPETDFNEEEIFDALRHCEEEPLPVEEEPIEEEPVEEEPVEEEEPTPVEEEEPVENEDAYFEEEVEEEESGTSAIEQSAVDIAAEGAAENEAILSELEEEGAAKDKKKKSPPTAMWRTTTTPPLP